MKSSEDRKKEIIALSMFNVSIDSGEIMEKDIKKIDHALTQLNALYKPRIDEGKLKKRIESLQMVYDEIKSQKWGKIRICDRSALIIGCTLDDLKAIAQKAGGR